MVAPNADLRCNAADAMSDAYWGGRPDPVPHSMSLIHFNHNVLISLLRIRALS